MLKLNKDILSIKGENIMISYAPLMATLHKRKISKTELQNLIKVSSATIAKISKDQLVSLQVINDICRVLDCPIEEVIAYVKNEDRQKDDAE
jgi:putative transcriptional regulator